MTDPLTDKKLLIEVYKALLQQDQFYVDLFERRIIFFSGIITAIIPGLIWAHINFAVPTNIVITLAGSASLIFVAYIGYHAAKRAADRVVRNITEIAKVEQALGLTTPIIFDGNDSLLYWKDEPIVASRHLESRRDYPTSAEFINHSLKGKDNSFSRTRKFYYAVGAVGGMGFLLSALELLGIL